MKVFYYFFTVFALLYEFYVLLNPKRCLSFKTNLMQTLKENKKAKEEGRIEKKLTSEQISMLLLNLLYFIWVITGLMSFNWLLFLTIFIISLIPKKHFLQYIFDSIITISILLFALLNTFHFKIELFSYVLSLF